MRKAIYAGSFDPFHDGHLDIVKRASKMFDEVYILLAHNPHKTRRFNIFKMSRAIQAMIIQEKLTNCFVIIADENEYTVDIAHALSAQYLIRGVRNQEDFVYEEELAKANEELAPEIETVYLRATMPDISSSFIRKLLSEGKDCASALVPKAIYKIFKEEDWI